MNTTFVLGAGFSFDAGFPLVRDLRGRVLKFIEFDRHSSFAVHLDWSREYPNGQFYAGLDEADRTGNLQFEELFSRLRKMVDDPSYRGPAHVTRWVLQIGCARMFWCLHGLNPFPELHYRKFASWLADAGRGNTIVSFNWDLVTETALTEIDVTWSYALFEPASVPILKPHGSINWNGYLRENSRNDSGLWLPIGRGSSLSYPWKYPLKHPDQQGTSPDLRYTLFPGDPDMPAQDEDLGLIWKDVEAALAASDKVVFIGYSIPDYDCFASEFFWERAIGKEIEVYNPKEADLQKYKALFGAGVRPCKDTFASCPYAN